jgi:hypothetical protein
MVVDLLEAAGEWEAGLPPHQRVGRRGLLALLCLAGPRIGEAIAADRGDFDLAAGRWRIPEAKTDSGRRDVELTMYLRDELVQHVATMEALGRPTGARAPLFATRSGRRPSRGSLGERLAGAVERANARRAERRAAAARPGHSAHPAPDIREPRARGGSKPALGDGAARPRRRSRDSVDLRPGRPAAGDRPGANLAINAVRRRVREGAVGRGIWPNEWPNETRSNRRRRWRVPRQCREFGLNKRITPPPERWPSG